MRNVWKGMILGALTGALAGLGLDSVEGARKQVIRGAHAAADRLPDVVESTKHAASSAGGAVKEHAPDLVDAVKEHAPDLVDAVKEHAPEVIEAGKHAAQSAGDTAQRLVRDHT